MFSNWLNIDNAKTPELNNSNSNAHGHGNMEY